MSPAARSQSRCLLRDPTTERGRESGEEAGTEAVSGNQLSWRGTAFGNGPFSVAKYSVRPSRRPAGVALTAPDIHAPGLVPAVDVDAEWSGQLTFCETVINVSPVDTRWAFVRRFSLLLSAGNLPSPSRATASAPAISSGPRGITTQVGSRQHLTTSCGPSASAALGENPRENQSPCPPRTSSRAAAHGQAGI